MRYFLILLVLLCFFTGLSGQGLDAQWSFVLDGDRDADVQDLAVDAQGNTYVAFDYGGSLSIKGLKTKLPYSPHVHGALLKLSPQGKPLWVQVIRSANDNRVNAITIAPNGDVLIAGFADGLVRFAASRDTIRLGREKEKNEYHHPQALYLARYSSEGHCKWVHFQPVKGFGQSCDVAINSRDEVFYAFHYYGDFGGKYGLPLRKHDDELLVMQRLDGADGKVLETQTREGASLGSYIVYYNLETDQSDNVYEYGIFRKSIHIGGGDSLHNDGYYDGVDAFLIKYNAQGERQWVRQIGGQNYQIIKDLKVDQLGEIHLTGYFTYECVFSDGVKPVQKSKVETEGGSEFFYFRLDSGGELIQNEFIHSLGYRFISGMSLALGPDDEVLILANTNDTIRYQNQRLDSQSGSEQIWLSQWSQGQMQTMKIPCVAPKGFMVARKIASRENAWAAAGLYFGEGSYIETPNGRKSLPLEGHNRNTVIWGGAMRKHRSVDTLQSLSVSLAEQRSRRQLIELEKLQSLLLCQKKEEESPIALWFPEVLADTGRSGWLRENPCGLIVEGQEASLFPNPSDGPFTLALKGMTGLVEVTVFSQSGKLMMSRVVEGLQLGQTLLFDISESASGVYFVRVRSNGYEKVLRLVKVER